MSSALLDTRSPIRARRGTRLRPDDASPTETRGVSVDLVLFRRLVRELILAPRRSRAEVAIKVVKHIRASRYPLDCVNHLLFECAANGGSDGLDIATDILSQVGWIAVAMADRFFKADAARIGQVAMVSRHSVTDDAWYALLRGICRSGVPWLQRYVAAARMVLVATASGREAAVHALGDLASCEPESRPHVLMLLRHLDGPATPPYVRETVAEVLRDMEG